MRGSRRIDDYLGGGRPGERRRLPAARAEGDCGGLAERLERIEERLASLEEALEALRDSVDALRGEVARLRRLQAQAPTRGPGAGGSGRPRSPLEELLAQSRGVVLASEARARLRVSAERILDEAERIGAVTLEAGGDVAIMTRDAYHRFLKALEAARSSDPEEAAEAMGEFKRVFAALRRSGEVYYDARRGHWVLLRRA